MVLSVYSVFEAFDLVVTLGSLEYGASGIYPVVETMD